MTLLTSEERKEIWAEMMRENKVPMGISKQDLRLAFDAVDDWIEANQTSFNSAIPQPARGALTAKHKAAILSYVALKRVNLL